MALFRIEIRPVATVSDEQTARALQAAGLPGLRHAYYSKLIHLHGALDRAAAEHIAINLLGDPVAERVAVAGTDAEIAPPPPGTVGVEIHRRPGVMDPEAESVLAELQAEGHAVDAVRTGRRYVLEGRCPAEDVHAAVGAVLANDCVDQITTGTLGVGPPPAPSENVFRIRTVPLRKRSPADLERLSREAHLFLSLAELQAIQAYYDRAGRDPTDVELETLAQSWSEHCVHKTLRSAVHYRGAPLPGDRAYRESARRAEEVSHKYQNLLRDTIVQATERVSGARVGPECLSVFRDNAGVIGFDGQHGIAFKVETHNHPSAIEPYGGSTTGIGGVIRDVIGCGLGARPIANTDVFCVAPTDWPADALPGGVQHPARLLRGLVHGVADYGNRMGIPTVNGAVHFDPRYLGNPLVYCGCIGLIPRDRLSKAAQPGDRIVLIGGRTGRDGIHGATFSSAELTDTHASEFSHAVQIGNAITEKRFLDAVLAARDERADPGAPSSGAGASGPRCLYTAITDCGAGGLSSAVGEMGELTGAVVDLERVPLKYAGLRYDEIWISEAQERMVLAVPEANLARLLEIMAAEETEATVIGTFGGPEALTTSGAPRLLLRYQGHIVGDLEMHLIHHGLPRAKREARWSPGPQSLAAPRETSVSAIGASQNILQSLLVELQRPAIASKEWIIRQYDHEVQGGSVVKPLMGLGRGPADAAVLRPILGADRGIAVGCGLALHLADVDPYWMAAAGLDEAVRNVVSVGGDPLQTALLDNFCWASAEDPWQLGALVRACQACHDVAVAYGMPFISGKDSLNNEFALDANDVEPLLRSLRERSLRPGRDAAHLRAILPDLESRIRATGRVAIPPTLLISALAIVPDVRQCVTPDLKRVGDRLVLVGGLPEVDFDVAAAAGIHRTVAEAIRMNLAAACHDVSDGGWLVAAAEMALAGQRGVDLEAAAATRVPPFAPACAGYVVATPRWPELQSFLTDHQVSATLLGEVTDGPAIRLDQDTVGLSDVRESWASGSAAPATPRNS